MCMASQYQWVMQITCPAEPVGTTNHWPHRASGPKCLMLASDRKPSTHNITHTAPFSSTAFTPLLTFRNISPITTLVPPDIGPDFGNTEEMDGFTYVYWKLDCAVPMVSDIFARIMNEMFCCVPPEVYAPATQMNCIPGMYPYDCTTQDTPPTVTLTMSPTFTPRLVPVMVSFVPPPNGPEVGETELNTGEGHWYDWFG